MDKLNEETIMSMFYSRSEAAYARKMGKFLGMSRAEFARYKGSLQSVRAGRPRRPTKETIARLEELVNDKAARAESADTSLSERIQFASDYRNLNASQLARMIGVSREATRRWYSGIEKPSEKRIRQLADALQVPASWLERGNELDLPPDSPIGVRVGGEALWYREQLYVITLENLDTASALEVTEKANEALLQIVYELPEATFAARRSGGRWCWVENKLAFAPWVPLPPEPLKRRDWPDETEHIIEEELKRNATIYRAWERVRQRCETRGIPYPQRITLHKRLHKLRKHTEHFGIALATSEEA